LRKDKQEGTDGSFSLDPLAKRNNQILHVFHQSEGDTHILTPMGEMSFRW